LEVLIHDQLAPLLWVCDGTVDHGGVSSGGGCSLYGTREAKVKREKEVVRVPNILLKIILSCNCVIV
jgi:acetoacetate decarboxylase